MTAPLGISVVVANDPVSAAQAAPAALVARQRKKYVVVGASPPTKRVNPPACGPTNTLASHAPASVPPSVVP